MPATPLRASSDSNSLGKGSQSERPIDRLFAAYGADHQNPLNVAMHCIAVPLIAWSVAALAASLPVPDMFGAAVPFNWAWPLIAAALIYYAGLGSWRMTAAMVLWAATIVLAIHAYPSEWVLPLPMLAAIVFLAAWALQFIGHYIEGRRPSFLHDLQFLLIGPAWVTAHVFKAAGIRW